MDLVWLGKCRKQEGVIMDLVWLGKCRCFLFLPLLASVLLCGTDGALPPQKQSSKNAYATMLYMGTPRDYEFYVAARVMFRSLARLKVDADLVLIASQDVPQRWIENLHKDGVKVVSVVNIDNPYKNQPSFDRRFALTLNKLYAWSLVEYSRVVMLDADNLFLQKTDELFQCGQFCAAFINPCIFHTGLFVLQPSEKVFSDMLHELASGRENEDGADQGFLVSYFHDLLDRPMFYPTVNGSELNGYFRLPLGYQMDASYYYLKLRWNVPCGPNSVITFPSAPWLKPWYWWAWPVLPLGFSWHEQRRLTIGYGEEMPLIVAESMFYLITIAVAMFAMRGAHLQTTSSKLCYFRAEQSCSFYSVVLKTVVLSCLAASYLLPFFLVPRTIHPLVGWGLYLLGSLSFLVVIINTFQLPALAVLTPWIEILCVLLVMAFPLYSNGIVRALSVAAYAFFAAPFLWWAIVRLLAFLDTCIERESLFSRCDQPPSELMKLC